MGLPAHQISSYRFAIAGFCFLLGLVNYLDRVIISFAIKPIETDFGIEDASFGLLMSAFAIGTLSVNLLSGFLLDRFGVKIVWCISLFGWSVVMALQGLVEVFWMFIALRVLLGIGEGVNFPAMNRALVDWMRPNELGRAVAISLLGVPLALAHWPLRGLFAFKVLPAAHHQMKGLVSAIRRASSTAHHLMSH